MNNTKEISSDIIKLQKSAKNQKKKGLVTPSTFEVQEGKGIMNEQKNDEFSEVEQQISDLKQEQEVLVTRSKFEVKEEQVTRSIFQVNEGQVTMNVQKEDKFREVKQQGQVTMIQDEVIINEKKEDKVSEGKEQISDSEQEGQDEQDKISEMPNQTNKILMRNRKKTPQLRQKLKQILSQKIRKQKKIKRNPCQSAAKNPSKDAPKNFIKSFCAWFVDLKEDSQLMKRIKKLIKKLNKSIIREDEKKDNQIIEKTQKQIKKIDHFIILEDYKQQLSKIRSQNSYTILKTKQFWTTDQYAQLNRILCAFFSRKVYISHITNSDKIQKNKTIKNHLKCRGSFIKNIREGEEFTKIYQNKDIYN